MNYRDRFYSKYVSSHTHELYGAQSRSEIERQFGVFEAYFGHLLSGDSKVRILDIGCGNGGFVHWLQKDKGFKKAEGIDISHEQVETAKRLGFSNISQAEMLEFLSSRQKTFDMIIARDVLEHFTKDENVNLVETIFKSLKPGGCFIFQTLNAENLLWGRLRHGDFTHETAFTAQSVAQLLRVAGGSKKIEIYPQRPVVHGAKSFFRYITWRCMEFFLKIYLLIETGSNDAIFTQNLIVRAFKDEKV